MTETTGRLDRGNGTELAWVRFDGRCPTIVFLPGFRSDMTGDKATALAALCAERGNAMLRFDYSGHGASSGDFLDGTIGAWAADALAAIDALTEGELILVGSSMGGWIALLTALARPNRIAALVGIAAATSPSA
jgi:pimeloyl-ACP methyl ester carboxylesterase